MYVTNKIYNGTIFCIICFHPILNDLHTIRDKIFEQLFLYVLLISILEKCFPQPDLVFSDGVLSYRNYTESWIFCNSEYFKLGKFLFVKSFYLDRPAGNWSRFLMEDLIRLVNYEWILEQSHQYYFEQCRLFLFIIRILTFKIQLNLIICSSVWQK